MSEPQTKPRKPKYKYTRELIKIAVDDGMTQAEIATLCRTQQSVVNGWRHGKSLAFEHQVVELKKRFASRLNRATSRVYLVEAQCSDTAPPELSASAPPWRIVAVEGSIVFRYTFVRHEADPRAKTAAFVRVPIARWVVHRQGRDRFVLVELSRRSLDEARRKRWHEALWSASQGSTSHPRSTDEAWVECDDDAGRWTARIDPAVDAVGLLTRCDDHVSDPKATHSGHDELALPFLVRRMLVDQGHNVPGLERIIATE